MIVCQSGKLFQGKQLLPVVNCFFHSPMSVNPVIPKIRLLLSKEKDFLITLTLAIIFRYEFAELASAVNKSLAVK